MRGFRRTTKALLSSTVLWLVVHGHGATVQADPVDFHLSGWSAEGGLNAGSIYALARTPDGFLWLGTESGLIRFDGEEFRQLMPSPLPASQASGIGSLLVDRTGTLWAGTVAGQILRLRQGHHQLEVCDMAPDLEPAGVTSLFHGEDGMLMATRARGGLLCFRDQQWQRWGDARGLQGQRIGKAHFTSNGELRVVSMGQLARWDADRVRFVRLPETPPRTELFTPKSHDGASWLLTRASATRGTRVFSIEKDGTIHEPWTDYPWQQASVRSVPVATLSDREGRLWVCTAGEGVFHAKPSEPWQALVREGPLAHSQANAILQDDEGSVWFGLADGRLHQARPRVITSLQPEGANLLSVIYTVCARRDQSIWLGTYGDGIYCLKEGTWYRYGTESGIASPYVFALFEDRDATLWAGTRRGLYHFDGERFQLATFMPRSEPFVLALTQDSRGALWASTHRGLVKKEHETITEFGKGEGLPGGPDIRAIVEAPDGSIWASVQGMGIFKQTGNRFELFETRHMPVSADVRAMHFDRSGTLWIATFGHGLFQIATNEVRNWTVRDGLPSNHLVALIEDDRGMLWLGTANGILGMEKSQFEGYERSANLPLLGKLLSFEEGLDSPSCSGWGQPVAARGPDGRLWFPNQKSVAAFHPSTITVSPLKPLVAVESLSVDGNALTMTADDTLRVQSGARRLDFHYTMPDLLAPGRVQFRHQLKGVDDTWVDARNDRVARYNLLPPGNYEFRVMASGSDRQWRECMFPVRLEIVPRLWERRSMQSAGLILLVAAISSVVWSVGRARMRGRLLRLEAQNAAEQERRRIARDLHDELGSGLTEIMQLGDQGYEEEIPLEGMRSHARNIAQKTRQVATALDEIVWTTNPKNDTLQKFTGYLCDYAQEFIGSTSLRCRLDVATPSEDQQLNAVLRHNLFLACKEALNNAARHSKASEIWVRVRHDQGQLCITIEDNGQGFSLNNMRECSPAHGNGLQNMRERIELSGGTMKLVSRPGSTAITFELPLGSPVH